VTEQRSSPNVAPRLSMRTIRTIEKDMKEDMKDEINKDTETLKNNQPEMNNNAISQINITIRSLGTERSKLKIEYQE
jgi:hypothetical protein